MASIIQIRRDTASNWTSANPTLAQGELGIETDTLKVKAGDGTTAWSSASYLIDTGGYAAYSDATANFTGNLQKSGSPVVTAAYTGDVDVTGELIVDSYNETYAAVTSSSNATTVDCEAGNAFSHTLTENTTFTFSNPPASGTAFSFSLEIIQDGSASGFTVTWPGAVDWPAATAPTLTATASAKDVFVFYTRDGGTTWYGFTAGQALG
tara:strand:+ start:302 stop:928 length:627 start_codon:yes stop_codon:yes gene_type:complete